MKTFSLSIGARLLAAFAIVLAVMIAMTTIAVFRLHSAHQTARYLVENKLAKQQLASEWLGAAAVDGARAASIAKSDSLELSDYFEAQLKEGDARVNEIGKRMRSLKLDRDEHALAEAIDQQRAAYQDVSKKVFKLKQTGRIPEAERIFSTQMEPRFEQYRLAIQKLLDHQTLSAAAISAASNDAYASGMVLLVSLGVLSIALSVLLAWRLARGIVRPLQLAVYQAARIAQGDLRQELATEGSTDEIGRLLQALNAMEASLAQIVGKVRTGTETITAASTGIANGNMSLSARTQEQAASLEETAASMAQLATMVTENAQDACAASKLVDAASSVALRGGAAMVQVTETMTTIRQSSERVADIVGTIDGIAMQTNILALNAAVEAAQAGERGRGFAVVASEVRLLAQRSAAAAREIRLLVADSVQQAENGSVLVRQAGITMNEIVSGVGQVSTIVSRIAAASHEQSAGVAQANVAVAQIDEATQRNAALVEQAAAAAGSLQAEAAALALTVSRFTLTSTMPGEAAVADASAGMRDAAMA
nr:methyl-accepting chemotaxis protein [uncultured Noviherbaspirillum sp.]